MGKELILVPSGLNDQELESRLRRLALAEGRFLAVLLAHLAEFDSRRLAGDFGQPSLFHYCVRVLRFSEAAAYKRIQAARAIRKFPLILEELARGNLNLAAVCVLSPHLRTDNVTDLVSIARGKTTRELEAHVVSLAPLPESPQLLRALPVPHEESVRSEEPQLLINSDACPLPRQDTGPVFEDGKVARQTAGGSIECDKTPASTVAAPSSHPQPLSAHRYLFRFTADRALKERYERARALSLGRPAGKSMEALFDAALQSLLRKIDPACRPIRKERPRDKIPLDPNHPSERATRRIPCGVKDLVWRRDGGQCLFIGPDGQRCPERAKLEYDHIVPWSAGGSSDDPKNIRLLCRMHNQLEARRRFGVNAIEHAIEERRRAGRRNVT